jgi:hypothetical protein
LRCGLLPGKGLLGILRRRGSVAHIPDLPTGIFNLLAEFGTVEVNKNS